MCLKVCFLNATKRIQGLIKDCKLNIYCEIKFFWLLKICNKYKKIYYKINKGNMLN